ncbi:MAG TPA: hypothetical protein DER56_06805 [Thermosipho africanus]|nr:hypothetical protein [Thermosipho africanus]
MNKILVIGAGVDKTKGIDMPLARELIPEIAKFSEEDGKEIEKTIKSFLPNLRFSFNKFIKDSIESIIQTDKNKLNKIINELESINVNNEKDNNLINLLKKLFEKLVNIQEGVKLDDETYDMIKKVLGEEIEKEIEDESIIEFSKISFTDSFKVVMKKVLKKSIEEPENPISKVISLHFLDIESLLIKTFLGFYNQNVPDIKRYLYISWMLWAYLKKRENNVFENISKDNSLPFYSKIPEDFRVISFNYTTFLSKVLNSDRYLYFHGSLDEYIRLDTRDLLSFEGISVLEILNEFVKPNINLDKEEYVIPAIIPPLKLKPVLSNKFIETWFKANQWIKESEKVVIIGYSFNYADEHFNDIIRTYKDKQFYIIDPDAENLRKRLERIFMLNENCFTNTKIQGFETFKCGKVSIIKTKADEIELDKL